MLDDDLHRVSVEARLSVAGSLLTYMLECTGATRGECETFRSAWHRGDLFNLHGTVNTVLARRRSGR